MRLPNPRGPLSSAVIRALRTEDPTTLAGLDVPSSTDALLDEDFQLALWVAYELHYRGFDDADDRWEWDVELIGLRLRMEHELLRYLRDNVDVRPDGRRMADQLRELVDADDGPSLSRYIQTQATQDEFVEFVVHRSIYQLKEADPHTWAIPRLAGRAKAALVEIQVDEYGGGDLARMHSELFRQLLDELGLDAAYGAYVDQAPAITLAISNVMSLFALRRSLRGALVGHLAAYEMTSSAPCRRYARGLRRLGGSDRACAFYDEHVTADALHEQVIAHDLCGGLVHAEPDLAGDVLFGAAACLHVDGRFAVEVLGHWHHGTTSLLVESTVRTATQLAG